MRPVSGYPYFLQEFGKQAWDVADGPSRITIDDVERSIPVAMAELDDGFFRVRTGRTSKPNAFISGPWLSLGPDPFALPMLRHPSDEARVRSVLATA